MSVLHAPCAVCGGEAFRELYPGTITDPERAPESYFGSFRTQTGYYPIVRCSACGLRQMRPRDDDATLGRAYGALPADVDHQLDLAARKLAEAQTDLLVRHRAPPARLLDVGAGRGASSRPPPRAATTRAASSPRRSASGWCASASPQRAWCTARSRMPISHQGATTS